MCRERRQLCMILFTTTKKSSWAKRISWSRMLGEKPAEIKRPLKRIKFTLQLVTSLEIEVKWKNCALVFLLQLLCINNMTSVVGCTTIWVGTQNTVGDVWGGLRVISWPFKHFIKRSTSVGWMKTISTSYSIWMLGLYIFYCVLEYGCKFLSV
jgi:hypothetical protein